MFITFLRILNRVRGKMRFWGKTKYGDKKSREKLICGADSLDGDYGDTGPLLGEGALRRSKYIHFKEFHIKTKMTRWETSDAEILSILKSLNAPEVHFFRTAGQENMSPPCSPDMALDRGFRDLKENKEPSPKVKRRRSVKISSVALEPAQWQNDALQILTCTNDYRSMNDFLMKKVQPSMLSPILLIHRSKDDDISCRCPSASKCPPKEGFRMSTTHFWTWTLMFLLIFVVVHIPAKVILVSYFRSTTWTQRTVRRTPWWTLCLKRLWRNSV